MLGNCTCGPFPRLLVLFSAIRSACCSHLADHKGPVVEAMQCSSKMSKSPNGHRHTVYRSVHLLQFFSYLILRPKPPTAHLPNHQPPPSPTLANHPSISPYLTPHLLFRICIPIPLTSFSTSKCTLTRSWWPYSSFTFIRFSRFPAHVIFVFTVKD